MSLIRIAARIAAVQALKGRTLVGDNVLDSKIGAIDIDSDGSARSEEDKPFISVYADSSSTKDLDANLRSMNINGATEFLFEAAITATHTVTDSETDESVIYEGIPATDDAFEFLLDIVCRQIADALTDPDNEWAEIFRRLCHSFLMVDRARTSGDKNTRLAAHQIKIVANLIADPVRGTPIKAGGPLDTFFTAAAALDQQTATRAALMREQIDGNEFTWQTAMRRYGLTRGTSDALLLTPVSGAEPDIAVVEVNATPAASTLVDPATTPGVLP